jgi:hypothetical protein
MGVSDAIAIPGVSSLFRWLTPPETWQLRPDGALHIRAGPTTDLFGDPGGVGAIVNAPALVTSLGGDLQLIARVSVEPRSTYDAGVLLAWIDVDRWAKLCLEYSPQAEMMVVSVVTRGRSDDCNSFVVDGRSTWLRLSRIGPAYAFHASSDGVLWQFVRHFSLGSDRDPAVGFLAQSPTGEGCSAVFADIRIVESGLTDLRGGE